ncbi:Stomatal closure-related actin-binding protein 2 [Striga hermonthica]|uniref:Stomatal closure-related actin-binding protein 2 n=1 Tax=Striga hermonthica TaxID=68872 RepID=A0A9N7R479_STRHE|nr:Stomatal closure-related actin-binding protein 2 [Striga hermonthica]
MTRVSPEFRDEVQAVWPVSADAKLKEVASLEGHVLLKKLRDALEYLKGRLAGRNKEDVERAISMVEALAVKLTQKEGELIQEKFEVKKLVNFLKQASEDAKKLVNQEKSFACAEIESARAVVQRIGEALEEQEKNQSSGKQQEMEGLIEEVQEARRIKLMHQPRKVVDMEHELRELRLQIREKCTISLQLQNELAMSMKNEENGSRFYELNGAENLGSILRIQTCSDEAVELGKCANKCVYAPEPIDLGRVLQADIGSNGLKVVISQMNGRNYSSHSSHFFHIGKTKIKLSRGWITKGRESYSKTMQLCGFRGGGNLAAKSLFWQSRKGQSFVLVFESERERNGALILARKYASDSNVLLAGPDDDALL